MPERAAPDRSSPRRLAIDSGGLTLAADAYGDPDAPSVVLLHGGGQTRASWGATGERVAAKGWHVVSVDLRGHGQSGWSADGRYGLSDFADDVEAVVAAVGRAPVLVGASLGGAAALAALGTRPALASGLVLVDVSPFVREEGTHRVRDFMGAHPEGFDSVEEAAAAVAAYLPHRPRPPGHRGLRRNLREVDGRLFWHWDPQFLESISSPGTNREPLIDSSRLVGASVTLRIPTLVVRGEHSDVLGREEARRFLELVPHAEFVGVADAHHMVACDDNTAFGRCLESFLERRIRPRWSMLNDTAEE